jgi:hypothetical protein
MHELMECTLIAPTEALRTRRASPVELIEAGERQLQGDTLCEAGPDGVSALRKENARLKELVPEPLPIPSASDLLEVWTIDAQR